MSSLIDLKNKIITTLHSHFPNDTIGRVLNTRIDSVGVFFGNTQEIYDVCQPVTITFGKMPVEIVRRDIFAGDDATREDRSISLLDSISGYLLSPATISILYGNGFKVETIRTLESPHCIRTYEDGTRDYLVKLEVSYNRNIDTV